jgi:hypothetical protein
MFKNNWLRLPTFALARKWCKAQCRGWALVHNDGPVRAARGVAVAAV